MPLPNLLYSTVQGFQTLIQLLPASRNGLSVTPFMESTNHRLVQFAGYFRRFRSVVNLALACLLVPATAGTACVTAYRCFRSLAANKRWTQRRRRLFGLYALQVGMHCEGACRHVCFC